MNVQEKGIVTLIKSALTGNKYPMPDGFSLEEVLGVVSDHNIWGLIYYGAKTCGFDKSSEAMKTVFTRTCEQLSVDERQRSEFLNVFAALEKAEIDYIPLKGSTIKPMYPDAVMRAMGDADILVRPTQFKAAAKVLTEAGYEYSHEDDHESVWNKGIFHIDLHKSLMSERNYQFYKHFSDTWDKAQNCDTAHKYKMTDEDFYIFIFTHFAKHYMTAGVGIKHITDLWVFVSSSILNFDYINKRLEEMNLLTFHENVRRVLGVWFGDTEGDEVTDFITSAIFGSAEYGHREKAKIGGLIRDAGEDGNVQKLREQRLLKGLFLPYDIMCERYAVLKKAPFLLPVMWFVRFFDVIFNKRSRINKFLKERKNVSNKNIEEFRDDLRFVGLGDKE